MCYSFRRRYPFNRFAGDKAVKKLKRAALCEKPVNFSFSGAINAQKFFIAFDKAGFRIYN